VPLGGGSCLRRTGHPFTVSGPEGPSQKIEFVFSASPETFRREPREFDLLRSVGKQQDLAACALCNPVISFSAVLSGCTAGFCRNKLAFPAIHGQQIGHHLPGYRQRRRFRYERPTSSRWRSAHPDGVERIHNASRERDTARKEMMAAHNRLNDFNELGIVPEDLKRGG